MLSTLATTIIAVRRFANTMPAFYGVAHGRTQGVFFTWEACQKSVHGFSGAKFKKFSTKDAAAAFAAGGDLSEAASSTASSAHESRPSAAAAVPASHAFRTLHGHPSSTDAPFLLQSDGGARGNPGPGGAGAVIFSPNSQSIAFQASEFHAGPVTNNQMEYAGLLLGLRAASKAGIRHLVIEGDSELMARQLAGTYLVSSPNLKAPFEEARGLINSGSFSYVGMRHMYRENNARADSLCNAAMDTRKSFAVWNNDVVGALSIALDTNNTGGILAGRVPAPIPRSVVGRGGGHASSSAPARSIASLAPLEDRYRRPRTGGLKFKPGGGGNGGRR